MGLDQYAWQLLEGNNADGNRNKEELAYWRKHPNLQGWMEALWRSKKDFAPVFAEDEISSEGEYTDLPATDVFVVDEVFNCVDLALAVEDIRKLRQDILAEDLPQTEGFFFGGDSDYHYREQDLTFCDRAEAILEAGGEVIYWSWW